MSNPLNLLRTCIVIILFCSLVGAQSTNSTQLPVVPQLVNFSGKTTDVQGRPVTGIIGITFSIYDAQEGGAPLWMETQNVQPDAKGNYTVQLGATTLEGLPLDLFASGEARWLGVRINGGEEQPRVFLLSVPYALKAADAQTLGGLPASAFALAAPATSSTSTPPGSASRSSGGSGPNIGGSGTEDYIPLWTDNNGDLGNSILYQSGTGSSAKIGINEKNPLFTLDVNGEELVRGLFEMATMNYANKNRGFNSQPLNFESSAFNSTAGTYTLEHFQWQSEPTGNDTNNPSATLNLLFAEGTNNPSETGLNIAANGQLTFAAGQTFPGAGTITGVTTATGSGLNGGGTSGNLNLSLVSSCTANQVLQWNGSAWVCASAGTITGVTAGTDLTGGGTSGNVTLNLNTANVPQLNSVNAFSGLNTFPNVGVGTSSPLANLDVIGGGGLHILVGDPGCGTFAAIGFLTQRMSGCTNYALLGDTSGGTYLNASGSSSTIHFRLNNEEVMDIFSKGTVFAAGPVGIGTASPEALLDVEGPNENAAGVFLNDSDSEATLQAFNEAPSPDENAFALFAGSINGSSPYGACEVDIYGSFYCTGSKSAVVPVDGGSRKVALYAVEAPENWFEDFGSGQLSNGSARIDLDPTFAQTVNTDLDYHVFLTPNGDCKGLYVSQKSPTAFEVHELGGGASSVAFDYRVVAKRKNYETVRLADFTERDRKLEEQRIRMRQGRAAAVPVASNSAAALAQKPDIVPAR
ncbi:MAG TPA: hypothetical protein VMB18_07210 [Terriglobales bacterium]|nr:hypothetical protein [Terriglobales bacterium]